jgi:hypothetical protein
MGRNGALMATYDQCMRRLVAKGQIRRDATHVDSDANTKLLEELGFTITATRRVAPHSPFATACVTHLHEPHTNNCHDPSRSPIGLEASTLRTSPPIADPPSPTFTFTLAVIPSSSASATAHKTPGSNISAVVYAHHSLPVLVPSPRCAVCDDRDSRIAAHASSTPR